MIVDRVWVAPPEPALLGRLRGAPAVLALDDVRRLRPAVHAARDAGVDVRCVSIRSAAAVTAHRPDDAWRETPIVLRARRLGPLRELLRLHRDFARLGVRVFLPADPENLRAVRIAASLGVACGVELGDAVDWKALSDLAAYALLGLVPHAPVSPFAELADRWVPTGRVDFGHALLEDPTRYLHLDREGRVALGEAELAAGSFLAERFEDLVPEEHAAYRERVEGWRAHFLDPAGCAWCAGFRICSGRLRGKGDGCGDYCHELMDLIERHQARRRREAPRWPP